MLFLDVREMYSDYMVKRTLREIVIVMMAMMWKARWVGVPGTLARTPLLWLPIKDKNSSEGEEILRHVDEAIDRLYTRKMWSSILFPKRKCLAKGLVLAWYARKFETAVALHFGVKIKDDGLKGHCWVSCPGWVELNGEPVRRESNYGEIWKYQIESEVK